MAELKVKKKSFVKIFAPKEFNEQVIGESLVADKKLLLGRLVKTNMMSLTGDPKNQNIIIKFSIINQKGDGVGTQISGYQLLPSFIKRLVRKDKMRIDDCFITTTNDNVSVQIKPFLLTLNSTSKSVLTALRKHIRESLIERVNKMTYSQIMADILSHKLQSEFRKTASKIYPLKTCEIRVMQIVKGKKTAEISNVAKSNESKKENASVDSDDKKDINANSADTTQQSAEEVTEQKVDEAKISSDASRKELKEVPDTTVKTEDSKLSEQKVPTENAA